MLIPIIGRSAVEFWLGPGAAISTEYSYNTPQGLISFPEKFEYQIKAYDVHVMTNLLGLSLPLETFSYDHANHQCGKTCHVVTRYKPLLPNSFVYVKIYGYELAVARPELCFLQMAKKLEIPHLVNLGMQLCAKYFLHRQTAAGIDKQGNFIMKQEKRIPCTNAMMIRKFLEMAKGELGITKARIAAEYVIDNAYSPMESALATVMILPNEYGGYGLPKFTMNEHLDLSEEAIKYYGFNEMSADFYWREQGVVAEYNSKAFHMDAKQQATDADRINAMQRSELHVIVITYRNLNRFGNLEKLMSYLMEELSRSELKQQLVNNRELRKRICKELIGTECEV